jgi:transcriptional regulator with XRE-family HTH domain
LCDNCLMTITPALCRAARGLLGWNQNDLATAAKVGVNTLRNFEAEKSVPMTNNLAAIQGALEAAGVEFIPENGGGAGLRVRKPTGD